MLLKEADSKDQAIAELEKQLAAAGDDRRKSIEREIKIMRAGMKGEREAAYQIDFYFRDSRNVIVLHDLRIELNGRVAQIDHLMLNRGLDCFVLETKHFHAGLKVTEAGEFLRWNNYNRSYEGMASPLAQNERHIAVLKDAFAAIQMPSRLGFRLNPTFISYVLISPEARIDRPKDFDTSKIIKADALKTTYDERIDKAGMLDVFGGVAKMVSSETLQDIGRQLMALHKPLQRPATGELRGSGPLPEVTKAVPEQPAPPALEAPRCKACSGGNLTILYGSSYYFKCADCDGNTPARVSCGQAGHRERLRKEGRKFFRECADCGTSTLYFQNPEAKAST